MKKLFFLILFAVNLSFSQNLQVSGAGTGSVNGIYTESGTLNSKPLYVNGSNQILWDGFWIIGDPNMPSYYSFANVASPDLVSSWNVYFGNPPSPTVSIAGPKLSYSGSFIENRESNNGSISSSMTISFNGFGGSSFTGANGDNFVTAGKVSIANLPSGLTAVMTRNSATQLTFTLTGDASAHANANDLSNLSVVFQNAAFSTGNASAVANYSKSDISIEFIQQYTVGSTGNFTTISNAIAAVQNYDVLILAAETFTESNISINNKSISIIGQSPSQTIIQANANPGVAASRIFTINFSNYASTNAIRFEKLTIRNGNATNYAGGLFSSNANVEIENCLFENNYANTPVPDGYFGDGGGAMRVQDGSLSVLNSTFSGNRHNCVSNRPGDMMGGGAIGYFGQDSYNTLLNITNCTFTDNSTGNHGGAIMLRPSNTAANRIVNCTFSGNSAGNNGGALYFGGTGACQFSSTNSIYYGNTAGAYVSLYASFGSTFSFNNCVIQDNENVGNMSATYTNCIINQNPLLSALSDNGGYTKTLALQSGSVAINTGITSDEVPTNDQRGFSRVGLVDIGSHEFVDNTCVTPTENITTASSCDSYTWSNNGATYTESGTYTGTTENCVTEVLELTITPNSNNVTVASSCDSYTWSNNGATYTESGTYTGTTENCVTEVLELTITPSTQNVTIATGCDGSYSWPHNGETYYESGTYTGLTENCITEVLELTIVPNLTAEVYNYYNYNEYCVGQQGSFQVYGTPYSTVEYYLNGQPGSITLDEWGQSWVNFQITNVYTDFYLTSVSLNGCSNSVYSYATIYAQTAPQLSPISGPTAVCPGSTEYYYSYNYNGGYNYYNDQVYYYLWPSEAGQIDSYSGVVTWNTNYTGFATIEANYYGMCGYDYETLMVEVMAPTPNTTVASSCDSYTWSETGETYTQSGTYYGSINGCQQEVLELTITPNSNNVTVASSCGSYTWLNNGATYTESGTYTGTTENCVTEVLELTITPNSNNVTVASSCGSYTWSNNGATYTESGTYTGTTENCVTEVLELTVTSPSENITTASSCGSYTWSNNGETYTESGTYTGTTENCITEVLELTVNPIQTPTVSIATSDLDFMICSGTTVLFTSTAVNGGSNPTYQWKINGVNVSGQNGPTFATNSLTNGKIVTVQMISNAQCTSSNVAISNGIEAAVGSCTKIQASQCGATITSTSTSVWANSITGATNYKFEFTDPSNNVFVFETTNRYFKFSNISFTNNTTYSVRVAAKVGGSYNPYGLACDVRFEYQTKLVSTQCGISISSPTTVISAVNVAGATGYRFEITDPNSNVFIINSATRTFTFSQFAYQNNTTYSIRVAVQTANGYSSYGAACTVTFDKRTQLQASQCGITIDNPTTVITANSISGANAYRFELTDMATSNVYYVNSTTRNFTFSQFAYENNTTYSVRVSALTGTVYSAYGAACTVTFDKRTQLQASQCGITIDNPTTVITANSMAGATAYRFELTDMSTNNVYYVNSTTRNFTFSQFAYENNTTYSVRVSALTGTMYSAYGAACTVTFDKRTELQAEQCGLIINGASKLVYANSINGATAYRFEVTNLLTNTVYFVNSQTNSFMFSQFAYSNSANYSVRVSYLIGNVYSAYGTACTIGLEILTKVQASQCGIQVSSASTLVWSGEITSASSYKFELTDLNNNVTYVENATRNFKFNQFTYTPGMTYSVRVSTKTGSIYSNYGQACNVTAPGAPGAKPGVETSENKEPIDVNGLEVAGVNELQNAFDFNAYPNPSNGDFTVTCSEAVSLKIVNEMGQYIQSIEVTEANGNKVQVTDLPNGAYFITGTVGGKVITKKVIVVR